MLLRCRICSLSNKRVTAMHGTPVHESTVLLGLHPADGSLAFAANYSAFRIGAGVSRES